VHGPAWRWSAVPRWLLQTRPHGHASARRHDHDGDNGLDAYVKEVVDAPPPLTDDQRDLLALIFRSHHP
jgi:hypothetical protein